MVVRELSKETLNQLARVFGREAVPAAVLVAGPIECAPKTGLGKIRKRRDGYGGIRLAMKLRRQSVSRPTRGCRALSRLVAAGRDVSRPVAPHHDRSALAESLRYTGRGASVSCSGE